MSLDARREHSKAGHRSSPNNVRRWRHSLSFRARQSYLRHSVLCFRNQYHWRLPLAHRDIWLHRRNRSQSGRFGLCFGSVENDLWRLDPKQTDTHRLPRGKCLILVRLQKMVIAGRFDLQLGRAETTMANHHFPSCSTTPNHRASGSAKEAGSAGFWRTAVCTMTSLETGSTKIIWPRIPSRANCRCLPGRIQT
jgi:hypothetical protein